MSYPGHSENLLDKSPMPGHPFSQRKSEDLVEVFPTIPSFSSEKYHFQIFNLGSTRLLSYG